MKPRMLCRGRGLRRLRGGMNAQRQAGGSVPDRRHPGFGLTRRLEPLDVADQRLEQRLGLEQRERATDAGVYAVTPAELTPKIASQVEAIRHLPPARISIGGGEHESAALPLRHETAV